MKVMTKAKHLFCVQKNLMDTNMKKLFILTLITIIPIIANANCYNIKDNDAKNMCLARVKNDHHICKLIKDVDKKNYCLAIITNDHNVCKLIKNSDLKQDCLSNF